MMMERVHKCAVCGGAEAEPWLEVACPERPAEVFMIARCGRCGLRYVDPRPTELGEYYAGEYYSYAFSGARPRSQRVKAAVWRRLGLLKDGNPAAGAWAGALRGLVKALYGARAAWLLPAPIGGRFLDLGCGAGERLEWARDLGWETYGLDVGEEAVVAAASRGHRTVAGDIDTLPFADDAFDYVSLSHVLEHTREPVEALREVRRVLKPGGTAQIVVPNADSWGARHYGKAWRAWDVPRHLYHFDPTTLREAAERAGLRVVKLKTLADAWILEESRRAAEEAGMRVGKPPRRDDGNLGLWCMK